MKYLFFIEDFKALQSIVEELRSKVIDLGIEQGIAAGQSTENFGHDDACQEVIYYDRNLLLSRLSELTRVINMSQIVEPSQDKERVRIGSIVWLSDGRVIRIGSFMVYAQHNILNISYASPLGSLLVGKEVGEEIELNKQIIIITDIQHSGAT